MGLFAKLFGNRSGTGSLRAKEAAGTIGEASGDLALADRAWRTSALLFELLSAEGKTSAGVNMLLQRSLDWMRSGTAQKRAIGLNLCRYLFKSQYLPYSQDLLNTVLRVFTSDSSLAVKLAALDFLGAMRADPNPLTAISAEEAKRLRTFRARSVDQMSAAWKDYTAHGVHSEVTREIADRTPEEAMKAVIAAIDSTGTPATVPR